MLDCWVTFGFLQSGMASSPLCWVADGNCEQIGWFPDRDNMTNYCEHVWVRYAMWNAQAFADRFQVDMRATECFAGAPDRSGPKEQMWFDYMIRAADWFAGAVAAWDRDNNLIPGEHAKYRQMLEDVIAGADNVIVLHFDMTDAGMQFRRIVAERMKPAVGGP